jgi:hypothetical protein
MMQFWADKLDALREPDGKIVTLKRQDRNAQEERMTILLPAGL